MRGSSRKTLVASAAALVGAGVLAVIALAGSVSTGSRKAAATVPPQRPIYRPIRVGRLEDSVFTKGVVGRLRVKDVYAPAGSQSQYIVSAVRISNGETVVPGKALFAVSGRPVIAIPGNFVSYRDIHVGDQGQDVDELRAALRSLGEASRVSRFGAMDTALMGEVERLYRAAGFSLDAGGSGATADTGGEPALRAATDQLRKADQTVADAKRALNGKDVQDAEVQLVGARRDLDAARSDARYNDEQAQAAVDDASQKLADAAPAERRAAQAELDSANRALAKAQSDGARAVNAAVLAVGQARRAVTQSKLTARIALTRAEADRRSAARAVSDARRASLPILGKYIGSGELVGIGRSSASAADLSVAPQATIDAGAKVMTVNSGPPVVRAEIDDASFSRISRGMAVRVTCDDGRTHGGRVIQVTTPTSSSSAAGATGADAASPGAATATPSSGTVVVGLARVGCQSRQGEYLTTRIVTAVAGDRQLIVPSTAVVTDDLNRNWITVKGRGDGRAARVRVNIVLAADGEVAVSAAKAGTIRADDLVLAG